MTKRRIAWAALAAAFGLAASAAQAQSLKDRQEHQAAETAVAERAKRTATACGAPVAIKFDWTGAKSDDLQKYSAKGFGGDALAAIETVCGDAMGKEAVQKKVKTISYSFGAPRALALDPDGTLRYTIEWAAQNNEAAVKAFLMNAL